MKIDGALEHDFRVRKVAAPLRHSVTESIRTAIAIGRFRAGERLPERQVCEMLGVSRTLVREALRQLETEGLIKVVAHSGPIVASLTLQQAEGIYQVREELEGLAARLFAENATEAQRKALLDALEDIKKAYRSADPVVRLNAKNHFYECLLEGSGNEVLGTMVRMLNSRVMLLRATSLKVSGRTTASLTELRALCDALMSRDPAAAEEASRRHVQSAAACAISLMQAEQHTAAD